MLRFGSKKTTSEAHGNDSKSSSDQMGIYKEIKVEGRKFHHNLLEWPERWGKKESNR